jgi:hypothetical protein
MQPMQTIVPGTFKDGEVRLRERPPGVTEAQVLVTFLDTPTPPAGAPAFRVHEETGFSVLCLPPGSPPLNNDTVRALLADFP